MPCVGNGAPGGCDQVFHGREPWGEEGGGVTAAAES